jgi:hypothetical protein
MSTFRVTVVRIGYGYSELEVEASSMSEAELIALNRAVNLEFQTKSANYAVEAVQELPSGAASS